MRMFRAIGVIALLTLPFVAPLPAGADTDAKGFERVLPDQVVWKDIPNSHGVQMSIISGDPRKPGIYVVQAKFPPGIMSVPHFDILPTLKDGDSYGAQTKTI